MSALSPQYEKLLRTLLASHTTTGERPSENAFLRAHSADIWAIRSLVARGYIVLDNDRYAVGILGLALLPEDVTRDLVDWVVKMHRVLREVYETADQPRVTIGSSSLRERVQLDAPKFRVALFYAYRPFQIIDGGSVDQSTGELLDNLGIDIKVLESKPVRDRLDETRQHHAAESAGPTNSAMPAALKPRPVDDRYRNWTKLGAGAYADVWRAEDTKLGRLVAVKIIRMSAPPDADAVAHARALVRVSHPNVVVVYDVEDLLDPLTKEPAVGVVMELVEGLTLAERFAGHGFAREEVLRVGTSLLDAIAEFHVREMAHTDLHDENVILGDPLVKIVDPRYADTAFTHSTASRGYREARDLRDLRYLLVKILRHSSITLDLVHQFEQVTDPPSISGLRAGFLAAVDERPRPAPIHESNSGVALLMELLKQKGPRGAYKLVDLAMETGHKPSEVRAALIELDQKGIISISVLNENEVVYVLANDATDDVGRRHESVDVAAAKARLSGLAAILAKHLEDKRSRYFDPPRILDLFTRYAAMRDELRRLKVFPDLPVRTTPESSGTSDNEGRGYIDRRHLQDLAHDIEYCLRVLSVRE